MLEGRERLFASMSKNATKATEFFNVPINRVVELGTQVELSKQERRHQAGVLAECWEDGSNSADLASHRL